MPLSSGSPSERCKPTFSLFPRFSFRALSTAEKFSRWHRGMLEKGFYLAPSMYEAGFMSLAHTEEDVDRTIAAAKEVMATL